MNWNLKRVALLIAILLALAATYCVAAETGAATVDAKYAGLSWGPLGRASLTDLAAGTLLSTSAQKTTEKDLSEEIAKAPAGVQDQLKKYSFFALEQMVTRKLLSEEAKAWAEKNKVTPADDELVSAYLDSVASKVEVSDEKVEKFCKENEALLAALTPDQQKTEVKKYLEEQERGETIEKYVKAIGGRHKISISSAWADAEYQKWMKNPVEQARKSGKPTLLDFGAEWCVPCKQMAPIIDAVREQYKDKLSVVFVNTDKEPILATHYGANAIPLLVFYDKDGKEFFRHNGALDRKTIDEKLSSLAL